MRKSVSAEAYSVPAQCTALSVIYLCVLYQSHPLGAVGAGGFPSHQRAQEAVRFQWVAHRGSGGREHWGDGKTHLTVKNSRGVVRSLIPAGKRGT